jgi:hypothetical protein
VRCPKKRACRKARLACPGSALFPHVLLCVDAVPQLTAKSVERHQRRSSGPGLALNERFQFPEKQSLILFIELANIGE